MLGIAGRRKTEKISGGAAIARMLAAEGVKKVFGIIDGTYFGLYASLRDVGIELIGPRNEACAAHMAGAYARTTGELGVCIASNGPGVASVLPGVAVENAEGNRVLLITSARRHQIIGPDRGGTFQCFPHTEVTRPITKWAETVPAAERIPELFRKALRAAWRGRPGVVHLDVPEDIINAKTTVTPAWFEPPHRYRNVHRAAPSATQVALAAQLLVEADAPMIHAGSGVLHAGADAELDRVAKLLHAPVTTSWGARCSVVETNGYAVPMVHVDLCNDVRRRSDLVLTLGSRLGETDWWGKAPYWGKSGEQRMIQVDIDEEAIGANRPVELGIVADVKLFLARLADELERRAAAGERGIDLARRRARLTAIADQRSADRARLDRHLADRGSPLHPAQVPHACGRRFADDAICVLDGGNATIWGTFFTEVRRPHTILGTPKMGMLGAGIPQALGAKAAHPDRQVYCIIGDGAMGFQLQELETAVRSELPVIYLVMCDRQWGMVKINQSFTLKPVKTLLKKSLSPEETINADLAEIRFDEVARAMGAHGERAADPDALDAAIERAIASGKPAVIHVDVDPVKHMWAPALKAFKDMHGEPAGD